MLSYFTLPLLLLLSNSSGNSAPQSPGKSPQGETGTLEKMIVANGNVAMDLDLNRLNGTAAGTQESKRDTLQFQVGSNSFFTILVFDNVLRGAEPGSMGLIPGNTATLPGSLQSSLNQLVIEKLPSDAAFELAVRDGKTGFVFFNIEGHLYDLRCHGAFAQHQGRKAADFRRVCEQAWAAGGCRFARGRNLDRHDHVSDRNQHGGRWRRSIVGPARAREWQRRMIRQLCRGLMSSSEICLPWDNLEAAWNPGRAGGGDDLLQQRKRPAGLVCVVQIPTIRSFHKTFIG